VTVAHVLFGALTLIAPIVAGCGFDRSGTPDAPDATPVMADAGPACAEPPADLVAWWPGELSTEDVVGSFDGVISGGVTFEAGYVESAFQFDGTLSQIRVAPAPSSSGEFSIEVWVNLDMPDSAYRTIYADDPRGFWVLDRRLVWWQDEDRVLGSTLLSGATWHHVAITYDGTTLRAYVGGVLDGEAAFAGASLPDIGGIGGHNNEYLSGSIDELSIYTRALSAEELQTIASAGAMGKCAP
jgi:hypothetical protein